MSWAAPATETRPGVEKAPADAAVVAQDVGQRDHVGAMRSLTSARALMKEIFVARNALAATLASSAVAGSVTWTGTPSPIGRR